MQPIAGSARLRPTRLEPRVRRVDGDPGWREVDMKLKLRLLGGVIGVTIALAACGAGAPNTSDPAGTVKAAFEAAQSGGIARIAEFACAAQKDDITKLFGSGAEGLAGLGVNL